MLLGGIVFYTALESGAMSVDAYGNALSTAVYIVLPILGIVVSLLPEVGPVSKVALFYQKDKASTAAGIIA